MLRRKESFTVVTPVPRIVPRRLAIDSLHAHDEVITLNPLVLSHQHIPPPRTAITDEYFSDWYEIVQRIQYVPAVGKPGSGKISFKGCFHNKPWGLQTHVYAPMNVDIRNKYYITGTRPATEQLGARERPIEVLEDPKNALYLCNDVEVQCNIAVMSFVKAQLTAANKEMVQRIAKKAELQLQDSQHSEEGSDNVIRRLASSTELAADVESIAACSVAAPKNTEAVITASKPSSLVLPVARTTHVALAELQRDGIAVMSTSQRLWNAAYDGLQEDTGTAKLLESYVKTLTHVLGSGPSTPTALDDPGRRQILMRELVRGGLERITTASRIRRGVSDVAQFVISAKGMIDIAIQNIPQAALPWAGVCVGLQILLNPAKAASSNLAGITYTISRMDWYCALAEYVLEQDSIETKDLSHAAVRDQLEKKTIALYKTLLLYQIRSVLSYYRHRGLDFLRSLVNLDDWDGGLDSVKDAEDTLRKDSDQYNTLHKKIALGKLIDTAEGMERSLGDIHQTLQDFVSVQKAVRREDLDAACLKDLRVIDPHHDMERIERGKGELVVDAYKWIIQTKEYAAFTLWDDSGPEPPCQLLWIKGPAGTGKTMLMIGIIRELSRQPAVLATSLSYFFCQGTDSTLNKSTAALRSLIWLLTLQQPHLMRHLLQRYSESGASLFRDQNAFFALSEVFRSMLQDPDLSPALFAVDALDECEEGTSLIELISTSLVLSNKVKWLVSSRPTVDMKVSDMAGVAIELDSQVLEGPVSAYISNKLSTLKNRKGYTDSVMADVRDELHRRAENSFLWVSLVFKMLDLEYGWNAATILQKVPPSMPKLYERMMRNIDRRTLDRQCCRQVLQVLSLAYRPLSNAELGVLADVEPGIDVQTLIEECGSFLIRKGKTVCLIHQSAKEYLENAFKPPLPTEDAHHNCGHTDIGWRSIRAMSSILRRNIYSLDYDTKPQDMRPPQPDPLAPVRYSCIFWADHLLDMDRPGYNGVLLDHGEILGFLQEHLLHWVEALCLIGMLSEGFSILRRLLHAAKESDTCSELVIFLEDAERFVRSCGSMIEQAPLQIYGSALIFSPTTSAVKKAHWEDRLPFIQEVAGTRSQWDAYRQTLEGHRGEVKDVAFSPDCQMLASASGDGTIRLWDAATGACRRTLAGGNDQAYSVAFSHHGKTLAAAFGDSTVRLFEVATGACRQILNGHDRWINGVTFSPDSTKIASASGDRTVRLWDISASDAKTPILILKAHRRPVNAVAFSPDGKEVASASGDRLVKIWDASTGLCRLTLEGHRRSVNTVQFSPDGKFVASASGDNTVWLWDAVTGACQRALEGHDSWINSVAFSPDGQVLASASYDCTVRLWDPALGRLCQILHSYHGVKSVAFSPDGKTVASASGDCTIRLWDVATDASQGRRESQCGTGFNQWTVEPKSSKVRTLAFSADGRQVASSSGATIQLWEAATGVHRRTLVGHSDLVHAVAFSPDNKTVASGSGDCTVRLWDPATGSLHQVLKGHGGEIKAIAFSPDSTLVASASGDCTIRLWDVTTGMPQQTFEGQRGEVKKIAFSSNCKTISLTSYDEAVRSWEIASGEQQDALQSTFEANYTNSALSLRKGWITLNGRNLLWLPTDHRPTSVGVSGDKIVLGHRFGGLTFLKLDLSEIPQ